MKGVMNMCFVFVFLLVSCQLMESDKIKVFIPGVYVRHYTDEYTNSYDTITIKLITGDNEYEVIKKTNFEKLMDNGKIQPGYTMQRWRGNYDEQAKSLWLEQAGKAIYFNPPKKELIIGTQPYKKL
jgi:hypothetical protein